MLAKTFVANVVERTFAWLLAKDFEKTVEAMIKISYIHTQTLVNTSSKNVSKIF